MAREQRSTSRMTFSGAAKYLAIQRNQSAGEVISDLLRIALKSRSRASLRNGIRLLQRRADAKPTTLADVNRMRDEE